MDLRLVHFDIPTVLNTLSMKAPEEAPNVRLATVVGDVGRDGEKPAHAALSPQVRLAHKVSGQGDNTLLGEKGVEQLPRSMAPALLVSYYYLEPFLKNQNRYQYRDWVMDSGAFSAANSGKTIDLQKYIDCCLELMQKDATLTEIFALDVIGDPEASLKNCEEMWRQGVPAIPCFHQQEPEEFLIQMAKDYPKIALGGVALERGGFKFAWLEQCFARVWPKKIHGFGMSNEEIVYGLPFHSVDATNWEIAPCAFGNWQKFGKMSVRGSNQDLRSQVKFYLDMEAKARVRWKKEMAELEALPVIKPALALATNRTVGANANAGREEAKVLAFSIPASTASAPSVRLAVDAGAAGGKHAEVAFQKPSGKINCESKSSPTPAPKQELVTKRTSKDLSAKEYKFADYWQNRGITKNNVTE